MTLEVSYNTGLVVVSIFIAIFAAYTALNLIPRLNNGHTNYLLRTRIASSGLILGLGIWSMHFVGMMAFDLPVPVRYDAATTLWSLVAAVVACSVGLLLCVKKQNPLQIIIAGSCLGLGISTMHYIGMAAMRMPASMHYNTPLVIVSIAIGIVSAIAAIWIAFAIGRGTISGSFFVKVSSAIIMGIAISGMHYTGMSAMSVSANNNFVSATSGFVLNPSIMGIALTVSAILLMSFALWSSKLVNETNLIRASEEKISAITENILDVIITINQEGIIEFTNAAVEPVLGYRPDELIARNISMIMPATYRMKHKQYLSRTLNRDRTQKSGFRQRELQAIQKDGTVIPIDLAVSEAVVAGKRIFIGTIRDISERIQTQQRLHYLAHHDVLTTLPNRLSFLENIKYALSHARRRKCLVAVLFMDLDRFKVINDTLGHHVGDILLQEIAQRLKDSIREGDMIARLSGDEFTILLDDINTAEDITPIAHKLVTNLASPVNFNNRELFTTVSIGISVYPNDGNDAQSLMRHADIAMYSAKSDGGNCYRFYRPDMNARADEQLQLETHLRHALEREEFVLYYQPQVDIRNNQITGVEALLRWQHPERGLIGPADFIDILEETGLIVPVGEWVLLNACLQHLAWRKAGLKPIQVAVNLSARQFIETDLVKNITGILAKTGMDPAYLELEITENLLLEQTGRTFNAIQDLHALGIKLAIDDFGTGYSSLSYLRKIPIHTLKIDRSFICGLTLNIDDTAIVQLIIDMAYSLNLNVVAEGIEKLEQLECLQRFKCNVMQGFLFSRPVPADEIERLLLLKDSMSMAISHTLSSA